MAEENTPNGKKYAAILIRGLIHVRHDFKKTLQYLNLFNQHNCIIIDSNLINLGMLRKVKDFVAYGPVSDEVIAELEKSKINKIKDKTYRLNPPRGGFERKGIKKSFNQGGALGLRPDMDPLIRKML